MPNFREAFPALVASLETDLGRKFPTPQANSSFEKLVVCYWNRFGSAKSAEAVRSALEEAGLTGVDHFESLTIGALRDQLIEAGLNPPTKPLAAFLRLVHALAAVPELDWDRLEDPEQVSTSTLRDAIAVVPGIGPATADEILLRVFMRPVYPLDRATYRILLRHRWIDSSAEYDETTDLLIRSAEDDANLLADLSLWFEELGRTYCRAGVPKCDRCPLKPLLPEDGPWDAQS